MCMSFFCCTFALAKLLDMKKLFFLFALLACTASLLADGTKIGEFRYNLNPSDLTAEVTYKNHESYSNIYIGIERDEYNKGWNIKDAIIPENVTYKGITYTVVGIGINAFKDCKYLNSIVIPSTVISVASGAFSGCNNLPIVDNIRYADTYLIEVIDKTLTNYTIQEGTKWIGNYAFRDCSNLREIIIPNSVINIGSQAFANCSHLESLVIPNSVRSIGRYAFDNCNELVLYTTGGTSIPDFPINRINILSQENLNFYCPFSVFAKAYVEKGVNEWQKKDEFERVADWQKRVNEQTRFEKAKELLAEAEQTYIFYHTKEITFNPTLGKYDAENEVFAMNDSKYGSLYMAVPINEARNFKNNWNNKNLTFQLNIKDDKITLASFSISMPNGKEYTYRNTDAVKYNLADVEYDFDPLDITIPHSSVQAASQGKQNITTTKIKAGKSVVDTDIPETNASNPNTFVIIFANEDYKNVASVPFAKNDGTVFQKYCQKTLGVPTTNIHYVENASFNDIRIQLAWLNDVCNAFEGKASLIIYYAGHGIPDEASKSAYLLPIDGDGRYVQSAYKLDDMYQKLGAMRARSVTVFMDACFSGSKREDGMLASARGVAIKVKSGQPQGKMVVFSAASGDETAYPNTDEQHGMFTYYLLKKLQDTKGDVTLQELGTYITTNVRQQSIVKNGKSQTPTVTPSSDAADWQTWKLK